MSETPPIRLRTYEDGDLPFILNSWLRSYRRSVSDVPGWFYWSRQKALILALLERSYTVVACDPDDPDVVYGFAVVESDGHTFHALHWAHVKHGLRGAGVARAMLRALGIFENSDITLTHWTPAGERAARRNPGIKFKEPEV
jgi:hypothetical protein